jgi:hypothetical protein
MSRRDFEIFFFGTAIDGFPLAPARQGSARTDPSRHRAVPRGAIP